MALAAFDFGKLREKRRSRADMAGDGGGELRVEAKARSALAVGLNPIIGDKFGHGFRFLYKDKPSFELVQGRTEGRKLRTNPEKK